MKKAFFNWSGGKDSSLALYYILKQKEYKIETLLTNISEEHQRISMHGVSLDVLKAQTSRMGLPLDTMALPKGLDMEAYDNMMKLKMTSYVEKGFKYGIFGDIFLEDLKLYREEKLRTVNLEGVFPLWQQPTSKIIQDFISLGFKAKVVAINAKLMDKSFVGRDLDQSFINDLPKGVDVCGENGEFHSFVYDGPIFSSPVPIKVGEIVKKTYESKNNSNWDNTFYYSDLVLI